MENKQKFSIKFNHWLVFGTQRDSLKHLGSTLIVVARVDETEMFLMKTKKKERSISFETVRLICEKQAEQNVMLLNTSHSGEKPERGGSSFRPL